MSLAPRTESPALTPSTPDRRNTWQEAQAVPFGLGYFRVAPKWISDRFNDHWSAGKQSGQAYCSVAGVLCHGPIDYIQFIFVGGKLVSQPDLARPDNPVDPNYWSTTIEFGGVDADLGVSNRVRVYWGREDQPADAWLASMTGQDHPPYRGQVVVVFERLHCGQIQANSQARPALPNIEFAVVRLPTPTIPTGLRLPSSLGAARWKGVNLLGAFWDILTHPRAGVGLSSTSLDEADWVAKAGALEAGTKPAGGLAGVDAYVSPLLTGSAEAEKVLQEGLQYIDGWFQTVGGKIRLDWYPNDGSALGTVPEISEHDLVEPPEVSTQSLAEAPTTIVVECLEGDDPPHELAEAAETANVPFVREITGETSVLKLQRPWFTARTSASRYANRAAALATIPGMEGQCQVRLDRAVRLDGTPLRVGDRFLAIYGPQSISIPARLVERMETETAARLRWRRERGLSSQPYVPAVDPRATYTLPDPPTPAGTDWRVVEAPAGISETAAAIVLARRPTDTLSGVRVYLDEDGNWVSGSTLLGAQGFAAKVSLSGALTAGATTCTVAGTDPDVSPTLGSGTTSAEQADDALVMLLDGEWISIGTVSSAGAGAYTLSLARGRLGSTAATHADAAVGWVVRRDRIALWRSAVLTQAATRYFKLAYYHALADGPLSSAQSLLFADRKPGVPTSFAAAALPGAIKLTWAPPGDSDLYGYQIYEAATAVLPPSPSWWVAHPGNSYTRDGLAGGVTKYFWIVAIDRSINVSTVVGPVNATTTSASAGADGVGAWLPVESGTATMEGPDVFKRTGSAAWDASVYSQDGFYRGAFVAATVGALANAAIGLDTTPNSSALNTSIDYCFRLWSGNQIDIMESGSTVATAVATAVANTTRLVVVYDNASVRYYVDGVLKRTSTVAADQTLYLDSSLNTVDASNALFRNVVFAASGAKGDIGNTGGNGLGYAATSTTSASIGTGTKTFTLSPSAGAWAVGMRIRVLAGSSLWMEGPITAYNSGTGSLSIDSQLTAGSGTYASWSFSVAGVKGDTGNPGAGYAGTSTTSLAIGSGSRSLTTQPGLAYSPGQTVRLIYASNSGFWMEGIISSYDSATGAMVFNSSLYQGSGTFSNYWNLTNVGMSGTGGTPEGVYVAGATYYCNSVRQSIVYVGANAYRAVNPAKDGLTTWGTPGSSSDWAAPDATLKFTATDLALVRDQAITKTLTMGDGSAGAGIIRWNTATNFSTGNGIWMGYDGTAIKARFGDPAGYNWSFDSSTGEIVEKVRRVIVGDVSGTNDTVGDLQVVGEVSNRKFGSGAQNTGWTSTVAQGSITSPSATASGSFAAMRLRGYDGSAYVTAATLRLRAQAAWSAGNTPTELQVLVSDGASNHSFYVTKDGRLKTDAPAGGTSGEWKLGRTHVIAPSAATRTLEIEVDGTTFYIPARLTND